MITRQIFKRLTFGKLLEIKSVKSHTFRSARVRFAHLRRSDSINCSIDFVDPTTSSSFHWWWFLAVIQYSDDSTTLVHISHPFPFSCFTPHLPNTYYPAITIDFASVIRAMCAIWTLLWEWVNQMSHNESSSTHPHLCGATMRRDGDRWSEEKKQKKKQRTNKECFVENNKWPVKTLTSFSFSALNPLLKRHLEASEADSFRRFIKICSIIGVTTDPRTNYKICDLMFAPFSDLNTFTNMTFLDISVYWMLLGYFMIAFEKNLYERDHNLEWLPFWLFCSCFWLIGLTRLLLDLLSLQLRRCSLLLINSKLTTLSRKLN